MPRFFIEVSYKGTQFAGFQIQANAKTIQGEIEKAMKIFFRKDFMLTGSSRTDAGVHAVENYFHFDSHETQIFEGETMLYNLNSIISEDIVIKRIYRVADDAHSRFDAKGRYYEYRIYNRKDPFLSDRAYYYPYPVSLHKLNEAAQIILHTTEFQAFSKKNTQVFTYQCKITKSEWIEEGHTIIFRIKGTRFLRGMVRGLVGTMLKVGNGKISIETFKEIVESKNSLRVDFSMPAHGLTLLKVDY